VETSFLFLTRTIRRIGENGQSCMPAQGARVRQQPDVRLTAVRVPQLSAHRRDVHAIDF